MFFLKTLMFRKIWKKLLSSVLVSGVLILAIFNLSLMYINCEFKAGSPEQQVNEEWSISLGDKDYGRAIIVKNVPSFDDVLVAGKEVNGTSDLYYMARIKDNGSLVWYVPFSYPKDSILHRINAFDVFGDRIFVLSTERNSSLDYTRYLYVLSTNGTILEKQDLFYNEMGRNQNNQEQILINPKNPSVAWIAVQYYSTGHYYLKMFEYNVNTQEVIWIQSYTSADFYNCRSILYHNETNRIYGLIHSYYDGRYYSYIKTYNPTSGPMASKTLKGGGSQDFWTWDMKVMEDYIYILGQNVSELEVENKMVFFQEYDLSLSLQLELELEVTSDLLFPMKILLHDKDHFSLFGYTEKDTLAQADGDTRIFIAHYRFDENHNKEILCGVDWFGSYSKDSYPFYAVTKGDGSGEYYICGSTDEVFPGSYVGFIAKFPNHFLDLEKDDNNTNVPDTKGDFGDNFINQDWAVGGTMLGIGFLLGAIVLRRKKIKK